MAPRDSRTVSDVKREQTHHQSVGPTPKLKKKPRPKYGPLAPGKTKIGGGMAKFHADQEWKKRLREGTKKIEERETALGRYKPPWREQGNFIERVLEDNPKFGKQLAKMGAQVGGAVWHDAMRGLGLPGAGYFAATHINPLLYGAGRAGLIPLGKVGHGHAESSKLAMEMIKGTPAQVLSIGDMKAWYNDPEIQAINLVGIAVPFLRFAGVAKLATSIKAANPALTAEEAAAAAARLSAKHPSVLPTASRELVERYPDPKDLADAIQKGSGITARQAAVAAAVESYHPYFLKAHGIEGGFDTRVVRGKITPRGEGGRYVATTGRVRSRGPVGRGLQNAGDALSDAIDARNPSMLFSSSRRAAAGARRASEKASKRAAAARKELEDKIIEATTPSRRGRAAQALGLGGRTDPVVAAALTASLQGPVGLTVEQARTLMVEGKQSILAEDSVLRAKQDAIDALRTDAQNLTDQLDQIDDPERADVLGKQAEALTREADGKQDQLDFDLTRRIPEVVGSKARDSLYQAMRRSIGKQKANKVIQLWDATARSRNPENPASWYAANVSSARVMELEKWTQEGTTQFQGAPTVSIRRLSERGFHFPSHRVLTDLGSKPIQAGQVRAALEKAGVGPAEMKRIGIDSYAPDEMVSPSELERKLTDTGYYDTYDAEVHVSSDAIGSMTNRWGPENHPELNSREGMPGEYYEMTVRLPKAGVQGPASSIHWGGDVDVVYHARYQIFTDERGRKLMLVDEVQSDLASDYRKAHRYGVSEDSTPEEMQAAADARDKAVKDIADRKDQVRTELYHAVGPEHEALINELDRLQAELRKAQDARVEARRFESWRMEPSPMGPERYLRNAVHNLMHEADNHEVDVVVIADGGTQALRNKAVSLDDLPGVRLSDDIDGEGQQVRMWEDDAGRPLTNEKITSLLAEQDLGSFPRRYNDGIPELFAKQYGAEPKWAEDAYTGRYTQQTEAFSDPIVQPNGGMPGTEIQLTDAVLEKARKSRPMYQRDPANVPKGATEWLADGKARITMFEGADVSTWVHELAHVAVRDLPAEDIATLSKHFAEGRDFDEWTRADHENYARAFETYMRTGRAAPALQEIFAKVTTWMKKQWSKTMGEAEEINPETADVFDRMLGKRYQNTVLLDPEERAQVLAEIADLEKKLDDPATVEQAADALAELARQAEEAGVTVLRRGVKSPEQDAALLEGLARRKNAVVEDYRRRGLIGVGEEARGYFPHISMWEALGAPQIEATRIPATGKTIGTTKTGQAITKHRNRLVRYQTGEVLNDPAAVVYTLRARLRLLETFKARDELYAVGEPIEQAKSAAGWDPDKVMFIRNPDVTPEAMHAATQAMGNLSREDFTRLQKRREIETADVIDSAGAVKDEVVWTKGQSSAPPSWVHNEENVRVVPIAVARNRVGNVFTSPPRGNIATAIGITNALSRAALIYLPLGGARYIARNWIQNGVLVALTQPSVFADLILHKGYDLHKRDPDLWNLISEETGTIQAQALPSFNTRPQGKFQRLERDINRMSGQAGEHLGRFADVPLRNASWRRHAGKYGLHTDEDYRRLLSDPDLADVRDQVSQRTREDMIDFDTLTPWEKEVLTRYLFIWPFVRGAAKWPLMYAREYPERLAAMSLASNAIGGEDQSGPYDQSMMAKIGDRTFDASWLDPSGSLLNQVQALDELVKRNAKGQITIKPLFADALAPQWKYIIEAAAGDLGPQWASKLASTFVPGFKDVKAAKSGGHGFGEYVLKTFGNQTTPDSIKKSSDDWTSEIDAIEKWAAGKGHPMSPKAKAHFERMKTAYDDWNEEKTRSEWAAAEQGSDSLSKHKQASLILEIAHEHYPEIYAKIQLEAKAKAHLTIEQWLLTADDERVSSFYAKVRDAMFGDKAKLTAEAKAAGYKP